jgi:hypothetical protein
MEAEGLLSCSEGTATGYYNNQTEIQSSPEYPTILTQRAAIGYYNNPTEIQSSLQYPKILILNIFDIISPFKTRSPK